MVYHWQSTTPPPLPEWAQEALEEYQDALKGVEYQDALKSVEYQDAHVGVEDAHVTEGERRRLGERHGGRVVSESVRLLLSEIVGGDAVAASAGGAWIAADAGDAQVGAAAAARTPRLAVKWWEEEGPLPEGSAWADEWGA
eukprot:297988-Chlamydomonas_euryale.AAC.1